MNEPPREQLRRGLRDLAAKRNRLAERFLAEIEFAEGLIRLHPRSQRQWRRLIDRACQTVAKVVSSGRLDWLAKAVRDAEKTLAPIGRAAKRYTVHCVGHAHIDMNWMWSWPETVAVTNDTFLTVLKLMEEFPDFCFTQSQASVYAIARDYHPQLLEGIRRRVAEGRWEIAAVHWVEGDKNIACGEGLARHLLYTRRFMAEQFGLTPEDVPLDWEPDTFGHAATIPTIVSRGGVRRYYLCRGGSFDKPPVFWWAGPDGARILVNLETTWYNDRLGVHNAAAMLSFCEKTALKDWMCVYGVGDHGGGPTRRDIRRCHEMDSWPIFPNFRLATTRRFYDILESRGDDWPVLRRELNFEFPGCYTSQSRIKRTNRLAEHQLPCAEAAAALAWRTGRRDYPAETIRRAWIDAIFAHFHDILPGSCVREGREYHLGRFQRIAAATTTVTTHSLRALAEAIDTSSLAPERAAEDTENLAMGAGAGRGTYWGEVSSAVHAAGGVRTYLAFNPCAWPRSETVTVTVWDAGDGSLDEAAFVARMPDGRIAPAQRITPAGRAYWDHKFIELAVAVSVEAMGYTAFAIEPGGRHVRGASHGYPASVVGRIAELAGEPAVRFTGPMTMENELLSVRFDPATGGIVELTDKAGGADLVDPAAPAGLLEYILERPGDMSAWKIHEARRRLCPLEVHSVKRLADGPNLAAVTAKMRLNDSALTVTYSLAAGSRSLGIDIEADWLERGSSEIGTPSLAFRVPLALRDARGRYEVPFGSVQRSLNAGEEVPALRWADVTGKTPAGKTAGCALLNDSKHGHSLDGAVLRLKLIRSSYSPDPLPEIGRHAIRLALVPHAGRLSVAELVRLGAGLNQPIRVLATDAHAGSLPPAAGAVRGVRPAGVILAGVKKAEDEEAMIFRLLETAGRAATARVALNADLLGRPAGCVEVDLLERPVEPSTASEAPDGFAVKVPARGIASVKVALEG